MLIKGNRCIGSVPVYMCRYNARRQSNISSLDPKKYPVLHILLFTLKKLLKVVFCNAKHIDVLFLSANIQNQERTCVLLPVTVTLCHAVSVEGRWGRGMEYGGSVTNPACLQVEHLAWGGIPGFYRETLDDRGPRDT